MEKDQQWQLVADKLAAIRDPNCPPEISRLEQSWGVVEPPWPNVPRESGPRVAEHVLTAIDAHVVMGYYPPPELLLALSSLLTEYMDAKGKLTLEAVMFGKPKRRTGCFAARSQKQMRDSFTDALTRVAARHGKPEADIAGLLEDVNQLVFCPADAESLLRAKRRATAKRKARTE